MLKNLTLPELEEWCVSIGEAPRRAKQLARALYGSGKWVQSLDEVDGDSSAAFSAAFKSKVAQQATLSGGLELQSVHTARDGTHKLVFALIPEEGGVSGTVETVLIPMTNRQGGSPRYTACVSSQVGCAQNCSFCYTGRMGLLGSLSAAHVVEQVVQARRWLAEQAALATAADAAHAPAAQHAQHVHQQGAAVGQAAWQAAALAAGQRQAHIDAEGGVVSPSGGSGGDLEAGAHTSTQHHDKGEEEEEGVATGALSLFAPAALDEPQASGTGAGVGSPAANSAHGVSTSANPDALAAATSASPSALSAPPPVMRGLVKTARGTYRPWNIGNIVFMGMGEPLAVYDDTVAPALDILAEGLEISRSKMIVSTVGLADTMARFLESGKAKLALSLHATTDTVRDWIVPTNKRYPIESLMRVLRTHFPVGQKGDKFVVLEYVLLAGVNDTLEDAHRLVALTQDVYCMINLIVFNPWVTPSGEAAPFKKSDDASVRAFRGVLMAAGRVCTVRVSKGDEEMAACGQLGDVNQARREVPVPAPPAALRYLLTGAAALSAQQQQQQQQVV